MTMLRWIPIGKDGCLVSVDVWRWLVLIETNVPVATDPEVSDVARLYILGSKGSEQNTGVIIKAIDVKGILRFALLFG